MSARAINHLLWMAEHAEAVPEAELLQAGFPIPAAELEKLLEAWRRSDGESELTVVRRLACGEVES